MAIIAKRQLGSGDYFSAGIPYRVIQDDPTAATLLPLDAMDAAVAQGTADIGIAPANATFEEVAKHEVLVQLTFNVKQLRDYLIFVDENPGGTYTPAVLEQTSYSRGNPPQPRELVNALAINQKSPTGGVWPPDTLLLALDREADNSFPPIRPRVPIYPPQENWATRLEVPESILTPAYAFALSKCLHALNDDVVTISGQEFAAQEVLFLAYQMQRTGTGFGFLELGFAVGESYTENWVYSVVAGGGTVQNLSMTGVKPFSRLTYDRTIVKGKDDEPATVKNWALFEHRVWPLADFSAWLPAGA